MSRRGKRRYADLAAELRHFTSAIAGPSLELMGTSLELLRYEGLAAASEGAGMADNAMLEITPHPFAINPNPDLEKIARERGWTVYQPLRG